MSVGRGEGHQYREISLTSMIIRQREGTQGLTIQEGYGYGLARWPVLDCKFSQEAIPGSEGGMDEYG